MDHATTNLTHGVTVNSSDQLTDEEKRKLERLIELLQMMFLLKRDPFVLYTIIGPTLAYIVVLLNLIVVIVFIRTDNKTPLSILITALAISNSLASVCNQGLEPVAYVLYSTVNEFTEVAIVTLPFPFCYVYYTSILVCDCFRMCSVFFTTIMGVQRILAIKFPFWSRQHMTRKATIWMITFGVLVSVSIQIPRHLGLKFKTKPNQDICFVEPISLQMLKYNLDYYPHILWSVFIVSFIILSFSALCVMWYVFRQLPNIFDCPTLQLQKKRKPAVLVVAVVIVFIISEAPRTMFFIISLINPISSKLESDFVAILFMCDPISFLYYSYSTSSIASITRDEFVCYYQLMNVAAVTGCVANFVLYSIMSDDMRVALSTILCWNNCVRTRRNILSSTAINYTRSSRV